MLPWVVVGVRYVQLHPAQNFVLDVCRQFQPRTWTQTNPTPGLTLTRGPPPGGRKTRLDL